MDLKYKYFDPLLAISPIDGRHRIDLEPLSEYFSEFALIRNRIKMEVEYLIALTNLESFSLLRYLDVKEENFLRSIYIDFTIEDAQIINQIDRYGYNGSPALNHDVKACEYFLKTKLSGTSLHDIQEYVHFAITSEDCNNIAYNFMLVDSLKKIYFPKLKQFCDVLACLALDYKDLAMLSKTHGMDASPTTFGKEFANFLFRIQKEFEFLYSFKLPAKLNGAVGNFNAHYFIDPNINWIEFSSQFIANLGFEPNFMTTQIESHDGFTKLFSSLASINNILYDFSVNMWLYLSKGYFVQQKIDGEIGSSVMPHKINPWRLEVAEASTREANAKIFGFINKLQHSRFQRDLSDHEAQRAFGVAIGHSFLAVSHLLDEFSRLEVNSRVVTSDLDGVFNVVLEAVQTYLRTLDFEEPYEIVKNFSRGKNIDDQVFHDFIMSLKISDEDKNYLLGLNPLNYTGLASALVDRTVFNFQISKLQNL